MKLNCYRCDKEFETDLDLDKKVKDILNFPAVFWNLCDNCKRKEFSYTRDEAVAFRLIEGTCTEHKLLSFFVCTENPQTVLRYIQSQRIVTHKNYRGIQDNREKTANFVE